MKPELWEQVQRLCERAEEQPAAEREAFVRRECADEEVVAAVLRILRVQPEPGFLEPPAQAETAAGQELGDFTLLEELGRGGMGIVYRAFEKSLQRTVAVKVLPGSFTLTQRQIDRFLREARSAARLQHPNIVQVLSVGEERGVRFFAMEYVPGSNLAEEIKHLRADVEARHDDRAHLPSSRVSDYFRAVAELARQAADGLAYAHANKVVHRDVKPGNLLLDRVGHLKIVDFGLARDEEQGHFSTADGAFGTPHYMSPEQARGLRNRVDHRTDVYSLGVVLYELLTLRRPFEGKTSQEVMSNLLHKDPPRIRKVNQRVPRDLETICSKAMSREVRDRYADAGALRDDLRRFLDGEAIHARPPGPLEVLVRRARRHRVVLAVTLAVVLAALASVVGTQELSRRSRRAASVEVLRAALAEAPLHELPFSRQLDLRHRLQELETEDGVLAAQGDDVVSELRRDFESLREELRDQGLEALAWAKDRARPDGVREERRLAGLQTLLLASHLFPEDDELRRLGLVESAFPTLAVRAVDESGNDIAAEVYLREVQVLTSGLGERQLLGPAPLAPTPVRPGYYRVVVVFAAGGFRELVCNLGPADMEVALVARRLPDEQGITAGMAFIPAAPYTFPELDGDTSLQGQSLDLDAFWMDRTEISNAEYQRFLTDTGRPQPQIWSFAGDLQQFLEDYGDFPVVATTWSDAVAYAEWVGKRLPTAAEWHRAAGGPDNWPLPYSSDPAAPVLGNVSAQDGPQRNYAERWQNYRDHAASVRSHAEARTPDGLYHMYGNVSELTESMVVLGGVEEGRSIPRAFDRFAFGQAWHAQAWGAGMRVPELWGVGPFYTTEFVGFRCAKSAAP